LCISPFNPINCISGITNSFRNSSKFGQVFGTLSPMI
jgi:hypothetical protein